LDLPFSIEHFYWQSLVLEIIVFRGLVGERSD